MNSTTATFDDSLLEALLAEGEYLQRIVDEDFEGKYYEAVNDLIERERDMQKLESRIDELEDALTDAGAATDELSRQVAEGTPTEPSGYVLAFIAGAGFVLVIFIIAL